ncbi:MAG TPA: universal stress protein [Gaiellaceae bacterium]|nr:universal stress protein [Gaiellaceae bacterium]
MAARPQRILVGFDGSDAAWRALDTAVHFTGYGSTLTVVHVVSNGAEPSSVLAGARERVRRQQLTATYVQRMGEPADQLLEAARELDAELVVVGRRAESTDGLPTPGSVSATVVRRAPCDVLVVT